MPQGTVIQIRIHDVKPLPSDMSSNGRIKSALDLQNTTMFIVPQYNQPDAGRIKIGLL
jgi:hypothetical protein